MYSFKGAFESTCTGAISQTLASVTDITVPDSYTLVLTLRALNFYLLDNLIDVGCLQSTFEDWVIGRTNVLESHFKNLR